MFWYSEKNIKIKCIEKVIYLVKELQSSYFSIDKVSLESKKEILVDFDKFLREAKSLLIELKDVHTIDEELQKKINEFSFRGEALTKKIKDKLKSLL